MHVFNNDFLASKTSNLFMKTHVLLSTNIAMSPQFDRFVQGRHIV